jgi:hypothetical protein
MVSIAREIYVATPVMLLGCEPSASEPMGIGP